MTTKIRAIFLTIFFFCLMLGGLQAQDKYEYAVITYTPLFRNLEISITGNIYKKIEVPKENVRGDNNVNPALEQLNKMIVEGWELFDTGFSSLANTRYQVYAFYLRKKKE